MALFMTSLVIIGNLRVIPEKETVVQAADDVTTSKTADAFGMMLLLASGLVALIVGTKNN